MDLQMPIMDGYEATRLIRESGNEVPIIAMSANVFEEEKRKATESGVNEFIDKPIIFDRFVTVLSQFIQPTTLVAKPVKTERLDISVETRNVQQPPSDQTPSQDEVFSLKALEDFTQGDIGLQHKLIDRFISETPTMLLELEESDDTSTVERLCHTLKSMSASIGGVRFSQQMAVMEKKANDAQSVDNDLELMKHEHLELMEQLKDHITPQGEQSDSTTVSLELRELEALLSLIEAYDSRALSVAESLHSQTQVAELGAVKKSLEQYNFDQAKLQLLDLMRQQ